MAMFTDMERHGRSLGACMCLLTLYALLTLPVIISGRGGTSEAGDQTKYHVPTVAAFADALPRPDLGDYPSATAPGHHLVLAVVARLLTPDLMVLQLVNALASALLLVVVWRAAAGVAGAWPAVVLVLPLVFSSYFLGGAIWITTDNPALAMVALAVSGAVLGPPAPRSLLAAGGAAGAAVAIRQSHLWSAGIVGLAGPLASPAARWLPSSLAAPEPRSWRTFAAGAGAALAPIAVMACLYALWGGLTPPRYRSMHDSGLNPAAWPFALSLTGGFGLFFLPWRRRHRWVLRDPVLVAGVVVAVVLCLLWPTSFSRGTEGRAGGALWELVRVAPTVAGRSVVLPLLAAAGAAWLRIMERSCEAAGHGRQARLLLIASALWLFTQAFNTQLFQRYYEPWILITFAWLAALTIGPAERQRRHAGPIVLAAVQAALAVYTVLLPVLRAA